MTWTKLRTFVILWDGWECDSDGSLWLSDTGEYGLASRRNAESPTEVYGTARTIAYLKERVGFYQEVTRDTEAILNTVKGQA